MKHALICGVTESGKTTLARAIARQLAARGQNIIVYDPVGTDTLGGGWPEKSIIFDDPDKLVEYLNRSDVYHANIFVDECADIFDHTQKDNHWLLRKGRHKGFQFFLIAHRPKMVHPNVRTQCKVSYVFRVAYDDLSEICKDMGHNMHEVLAVEESDQLVIKNLDKGEYLTLNSGSAEFSRANIFDQLKGSSCTTSKSPPLPS